MKREAQLWSITGVLLVILLLTLTATTINIIQEDEQTIVHRAQSHTFSAFTTNFEELDKPRILRVATNQELSALTQSNVQNNVDDQLTILRQANPYLEELKLNITHMQVTQITKRQIQITYHTTQRIQAPNKQTTHTSTTDILITPTTHPNRGIIEDDWEEDEEAGTCLAQAIYTDADCNEIGDLKPPEELED